MLCIFVMICAKVFAQASLVALHNDAYDVVYNPRTCNAEFVTYILDDSDIGGLHRSDAGAFRVDKRCPKPRATTKDYVNSGYHRGHLCPSADRSANAQLMRQTYLLSNVVPMVPRVNMVGWKMTESVTRMMAQKYGRVRVRIWTFIEGRDTSYLRCSPVAIPTHFAKQVCTVESDSVLVEWRYANR